MDLKDKYFHSIHSYLETEDRNLMLEDILDKMEKIFKCGFILPRKEITKLYGNTISKNIYSNLNGNDFISVSLHSSNPQILDEEYKNTIPDYEDAFQSFILQEPSIVLNGAIQKELKFLKCNGIYLERFVAEPIPLKYMDAISVFSIGMIEPFFRDFSSEEYHKCIIDSSYRKITIEFLDKIKELLKMYNYNVPIIDICQGNEYKENNSYRKYIKTLNK